MGTAEDLTGKLENSRDGFGFKGNSALCSTRGSGSSRLGGSASFTICSSLDGFALSKRSGTLTEIGSSSRNSLTSSSVLRISCSASRVPNFNLLSSSRCSNFAFVSCASILNSLMLA